MIETGDIYFSLNITPRRIPQRIKKNSMKISATKVNSGACGVHSPEMRDIITNNMLYSLFIYVSYNLVKAHFYMLKPGNVELLMFESMPGIS